MGGTSRSWKDIARVIIVGLVLLFCTAWFSFLYSVGKVEIVYSYLYYLPIVVAAFFYGIPGGFIVSALIGLAYSIFVCASGIPYTKQELVPGIGSFIVIGLLTGLLSSHLVKSRQELAERVSQLSTITETSLAVSSSLQVKEVLEIVVKKIVRALSCKIGSILLFDPEGKLLTVEASHGIDEEIVKTTKIEIGERISGWVGQHGEPVLVDDVDKDPRFAGRDGEKYYRKSLISMPLKVRGEIIGVVNVNNKRGGQAFTQADLQLLNGIASQASMAIQNARLYDKVNQTYISSIKALALAIDEKDHYTRAHSENVTRYAVAIAEEMNLPAREIEEISQACQLHDLGKIGVHDYILNKSGELTDAEWEEVRLHSLKGAEILEPLDFLGGVTELVRQHHERHDGKGYPDGHKGEDIQLGARIMTVADSYDAMTTARPYRKARSSDEAISELRKGSGKQFHPQVVQVFLGLLEKKQVQLNGT